MALSDVSLQGFGGEKQAFRITGPPELRALLEEIRG